MSTQAGYTPQQSNNDNWRSGTGATLPDGTNDPTENITHNGPVGVGIADPSTLAAAFDVNGAEVLRQTTLANFAANAVIGTAAATVDPFSTIAIPQTTAGITLTIPNPTNAQAGRRLIVENTGTTPVTVGGLLILNGQGAGFAWSGTAWIPYANGSAQDFWRQISNGGLPDGTTDTTDAIRRLGHVGIGGAAVTDAMPTITTPVPVSNFLHLSPAAAGVGQIMFGSEPLSYFTTRTIPAVVNNYVDVCTLGTAGAGVILTMRISVQAPFTAAGHIAKYYEVGIVNGLTASAWRLLTPVLDTNNVLGAVQDFELLMNVSSSSVAFRVRRTVGTATGTLRFRIEAFGFGSHIFTELVTTGTDAAAYAPITTFPSVNDFWRSGTGGTLPDGTTDTGENVSRSGNVGIGIADPSTLTAAIDIVGAQVLRPVTLANFAASIVIGTAPTTVDNASEIIIPQTTAGITLTLPNPTNAQAGRLLTVVNTGTAAFIIAGQKVWPSGEVKFSWTGTAWAALKHMPYLTPIATAVGITLDPVVHHGETIEVSAAATITVPTTLPVGFMCSITQTGAGAVTFAGSGGMVVNNRWSATKTAGQWAKAGLEVRAINSAILSGDVM